ncbi:MAG: DUF262 domain-containing protein [Proteobacteria bacterium]|nr:DUF262 domain-containing protein [Pseudomonadota bacterium]
MKTEPVDVKIADLLDLKKKEMLVINSEYQRGAVWNTAQKKKLVDSVLRGYPIPLIYFHHIRQQAGLLVSERYEVIDGQQRILALAEFREGAFKLYDPVKDFEEARFPEFIKKQPCPWAGKTFDELSQELADFFLSVQLRVVRIETHDSNEARDLFVRLQAGMPLNSQEKRDAWPGQFTDFILKLGGKQGISRYPGNDFFNVIMKAGKSQDRGKFRQLAAQIAMLYLTRRDKELYCDINAASIDDFYYENLGFDSKSTDAVRIFAIFEKLTKLLRDQKRSKVVGHEAIHLVLLVDTLIDDYTPTWEDKFAGAFDRFREEFSKGKLTKNEDSPSEYWLRYGVLTRVNSDRGDSIRRRHDFFASKMLEFLKPQLKDPKRLFGAIERDLIYYRDKKRCVICNGQVAWSEAEFHHVEEHSKGGATNVDNGVLVHQQCHPLGQKAVEFAQQWPERLKAIKSKTPLDEYLDDFFLNEDDNGDV